MVLLKPDLDVYCILVHMAASGSYIPHTISDQDVIETVFPTQVTYAPWPRHVHAQSPVASSRAATRDRAGGVKAR